MKLKASSCDATAQRDMDDRPAFSLIELLVVVAIIAVLVALIVVGLRRVQVAAARTESVNALRQMITGYIGYTGDNNGRLMPGFVDYANPDKYTPKQLNARIGAGDWIVSLDADDADREMLSSYVWRLAPYLGHNWQTMLTDYRDAGVRNRLETQYATAFEAGPAGKGAVYKFPDELTPIAMAPAYGLNSIFFGGDDRHGGINVSKYSPWGANADDRIAATRTSEVVNARAIVFAPAAAGDPSWAEPGDDVYLSSAGINGYPELRPPFLTQDAKGVWQERQWFIGIGARIEPTDNTVFAKGVGLPITRRGSADMIPIARFDGSAEVLNLGDISVDMRHWSPLQTGAAIPPADVP